MACFVQTTVANYFFFVVVLFVSANAFNDVRHVEPLTNYSSAFEEASVFFGDFQSQANYIYKIYCLQDCSGKSRTAVNRYCLPCFCDRSCRYYGDCCPDLNVDYINIVSSKCLPTSFPRSGNDVMMIDYCPKDHQDPDLVEKCTTTSVNDWRSIQPVTDDTTGLTYRNRFCAQCNDVEKSEAWRVGTICEKGPPWNYRDASKEDVYLSIVNTQGCKVQMVPPDNYTAHVCSKFLHKENGYSDSCNETGYWKEYDPLVERGCYTLAENPVGTYKNLFCYICNHMNTWVSIKTETTGYTPNVFLTKLSALLDMGDDNDEEQTSKAEECPMFDPYLCNCRNVSCVNGKRFQEGRCISVYKLTNSYIYQFCLDVAMKFNSSMVNPDRIQQPIIMLERRILEMNVIPALITSSVRYLSPCRELMNIAFKINCTVFFREPADTNRFEDFLLTEVPQLGKTANESMPFEVSFTYQCKNEEGRLLVNSDSTKPCTWYNTGMVTTENFKNRDLTVLNRAQLIVYKKIYTCPRMLILHSEVTISADRTSLVIKVNNKTLGIFEFEFAEEGGYFICVDDYVGVETFKSRASECEEIKLDKSLSKPKPKYSPLGLLSGICTSCSLVFLIATFLVFCLLKKYRTSIGISIMILTVTLFVAQALFEFGAEQTEIKWVCETLGVLIHHFWLSTTFWMNVCTIILFYNLSYPIESRVLPKRNIVLSSILYTWGCPMIIVTIVILSSKLRFGNLGYGGSSCYITTPTLRRFAFALPVGVLVLLNVILFCYTFINLRRDKKLQSNKENQISMFACLKLSVITGLTWIFSFIYEATGYETFHYIFTVLFGAQGVILFLAFVCNRRVYGELKGKIYGKSENRVYEERGNSTIGHATTVEGIGPPNINTLDNPENGPREEHI
ncbi:hypothetical protein SNE40_000961 [Patella caerulea]|uniref:G-protein coupled receptors family 2 profile 2 domain-containing protein n=1 Tax=Patella caerulea TaxID=87958 RepID=A0AAN8QHK7_PATCE